MNFSGLVIFLTFWNFNHAGKHSVTPALFFDWEEEKLVEIEKYDNKATYKSCISACPPDSNSPEEKLLNDKASVTKNSIFMRDVYPQPVAAEEIDIEICVNPFTPALAWNYKLLSYDVGYELYYEEGYVESKPSSYDFYSKVIDGQPKPEWKKPSKNDLVQIDRSGENVSFEIFTRPEKNQVIDDESRSERTDPQSENPIRVGTSGEITGFEIAAEPEHKLLFYWINVLSFDISNDRQHRVVTFNADTINDYLHRIRTIYFCEAYFTGNGRKIANKNTPEKDVQIQVFDTKPQIKEESKKSVDCLVKAQIIPMRMFHTLAARLATCMHLNIAFVRETIANGLLKKIDLFVYAIYREWPKEIIMSFGVNDHLPVLNPDTRKEIASEDSVFHKFPIPKVIFRLVKISVIDSQHYGAVIVVHNDLEPVKDTDRICSTEDEVESWSDNIKDTNSETAFTSYVCPQTKEVLMKLGFDEKIATTNMKPLKLNEFPQMDDETKQIRYISVLDRVNRRLDDIKKMKILD